MCSSSPPPAPDYAPVAASTEAAAKMASDAAANQLAFQKQVYGDNQPRQQALYEAATQLAEQELGASKEQQDFSTRQRKDYENGYAQNEHQTVMDSAGAQYLSPEDTKKLADIVNGTSGLTGTDLTNEYNRITQAASEAAATQAGTRATADAAAAQTQAEQSLTRLGGDSGRMAASAAAIGATGGLMRAGAENTARTNAINTGIGLRTGVANFGRNMPNTALQSGALATNAGNSGVGNMGTGANAGLAQANVTAGGYGSAMTAAQIQNQGALGYGGLMANTYGTQSQYASLSNGGMLGGLMGLAGAGIKGYAAMNGGPAALAT